MKTNVYRWCIIALIALIAGSCVYDRPAGSQVEPASTSVSQAESAPQAEPVLEPLRLESDVQEAFYSFDWLEMSQAEYMDYFSAYLSTYNILFADLDFDGEPEILINLTGHHEPSINPTTIFQVSGKRLAPIGNIAMSMSSYGPDSWRENAKRYLEKANGEKVLVEYLYDRVNNVWDGRYLYEVSLEDFKVTPITFYSVSSSGQRIWERYIGERSSYTDPEAVNPWGDRAWENPVKAEISEAEYQELQTEYLAGLTEAGIIKTSDWFRYDVLLAEYGNNDFDRQDLFDITLPDNITQEQKNELINRSIAEKMFEEYWRFRDELNKDNPEPVTEPVWQRPVYSDPLQAVFCNFQWIGDEQKPLFSILGNPGGYDIQFGDIDLDGEVELLMSKTGNYYPGEYWGGCEVYQIRQDGLTYKGGFVFGLMTGEHYDNFLKFYFRDEQGEPMLPLSFAHKSDPDPAYSGRGNGGNTHTFLYTVEVSLTDLEPHLIAIDSYSGDYLIPASASKADNLVRNLPVIDEVDIHHNPENYGLQNIPSEDYLEMMQRYEDGFPELLPLNLSDSLYWYHAYKPDYTDESYGDPLEFPVKAPIEEFEQYRNDQIGNEIYATYLAFLES